MGGAGGRGPHISEPLLPMGRKKPLRGRPKFEPEGKHFISGKPLTGGGPEFDKFYLFLGVE